MALGIALFVVPQAKEGLANALLWGALFGLIVYGVYNFTNLAILGNYPWTLAFADIVWGILVTALVSIAAVFARKIFLI